MKSASVFFLEAFCFCKLRGNIQANSSPRRVKFGKFEEIGASSSQNSWTTYDAEIFIDQSKVRVFLASDPAVCRSDAIGSPQTVICHFPDFGTWIEYKSYSLLGYFESLREIVEDAKDGGSTSVKAPMPCKVLSILKKNGDDVKNGETVMVIESMKMETNVTIGAAGKFMTNVKEGESVSDGNVLCWVESA